MTNECTGILVVDDEFSVRDSLCNWFRKGGYRVGAAENAADALRQLQDAAWDLVLVDVRMPGMDGLELQERIKRINPEIVIIIITAYASVETAVQALKEGAFDYITKPIDPDQLDRVVRNAVERHRLRTENIRLREQIEGRATLEEIVGESASMQAVRELVHSAAGSDAAVLIRGDGGTGKEHVARAIHAHSARRYFSFVPVSCGAMSEPLLRGELFGHESGAVPGAQYARKGRLELADGGTLFLDQIGTVGAGLQVDLLRVMDTRECLRAGGVKPLRTDLRVIGATTQDLSQLVQAGQMREDFFYRISVVTIDLPPLRERPEDIPCLARHFVQKFATQMNRPVADIDPEAMDILLRHDWPGNVRELANSIERALVVGTDVAIRAADLPVRLSAAPEAPRRDTLAEIEKAHIARILGRTAWNIDRAAAILGVDRATLCARIAKHGLRE